MDKNSVDINSHKSSMELTKNEIPNEQQPIKNTPTRNPIISKVCDSSGRHSDSSRHSDSVLKPKREERARIRGSASSDYKLEDYNGSDELGSTEVLPHSPVSPRHSNVAIDFDHSKNAAGSGDDKHKGEGKHKEKYEFKARKQTYKVQKKKVAREFSSALKDKSVIILSSWLKIRGTLKNWSKYWCVIKPEVMIIYKGHKHHHWVGSVMINNCEFIIRPSSKEGFCFKIFQPYRQNIWAAKGPKGEVSGALVQPMPRDHLILRAANEEVGRCWLDALEVAQRSTLVGSEKLQSDLYGGIPKEMAMQGDESDHLDDDSSDEEEGDGKQDIQDERENYAACASEDEPFEETSYTVLTKEELGEAGETTEEIEDENKSVLWALLKQVRPGMDLSKVTLPTFILEARSYLDKLSDFYYHSDLLSVASRVESPYMRIKEVVKWYLSGFYKKPKGLKKPYNPIIGEMFRCMWSNDKTGSRTFFVAEQISHHPPVSAFYCSNRKDGFSIGGSVLTKSKFYGNSTSAILDGTATLTFLKLGEEYTVDMPYAHVKGLLIGSLTVELGGVVNIRCEKTGYAAEIEFKLKPFWKKSAESNFISGKIRMGNDVLSKIEGKWDQEIMITEYNKNGWKVDDPLPETFFEPTPPIKAARLKRYMPEMDRQENNESDKLWAKVAEAIVTNDQEAATREKLVLEDAQRILHKDLKENEKEWEPKLFERDHLSSNPHAWLYRYRDLRPWDPNTDLLQYESNGIIKTRTRIKVPIVRAMSIVNINNTSSVSDLKNSKSRLPSIVEPIGETARRTSRGSFDRSSAGTTHSEEEEEEDFTDERSQNMTMVIEPSQQPSGSLRKRQIQNIIKPYADQSKEVEKQLSSIRLELRRINQQGEDHKSVFHPRDWLLVAFIVVVNAIFVKLLSH